MADKVRIELLGELRVFAPGGERIELPASRKTRALLAYLALTGRPQFREHLCDLLWDGPDDPRGALRWSLSRLRAALNKEQCKPIDSDRRTVTLLSERISVDLREAQAAMKGPSGTLSVDALREVAALFRGDLLEGLDLLEAFRFHTWCAGQREAARALRIQALTALVEHTSDPDEALQYAHALVSIDPLSEAAHTKVIGLLLEQQRHSDAQEQARTFRRTLEIELGAVPPGVAARLRKVVHSEVAVARRATARPTRVPAVEAVPLVGRTDELARLAAWLGASGAQVPLAVIAGEPGAGKTRLMSEVLHGPGASARVIGSRAYRAESARAFGPWRDALADIDGSASVLTSADAGPEKQQRSQLFDELLALIVAQVSAACPLIIALDDLQWLDEASVAFMHFLARSRAPHISIIGTVRAEEVIDNPAVGQALDSLRAEGALLEVELAPLGPDEIEEICAAVGDSIDGQEVFRRSEGNPFLATEIARALARGDKDLPGNVQHLVGARLQALSEPARELLPWAAALGRRFHIDVLERVSGLDALALLERVGELEERGVFEPGDTGAYDFAHDLIRDAAYGQLSGPRQRILHRSIARSLDSWTGGAAVFSPTELLRHAELGGEAAIACRAGVDAAQDALSVCAWVDACVCADRGLQHTAALEGASRVATTLALLNCRIVAGSILGRQYPEHVSKALDEVIELGGTAQQQGLALTLQSMMRFAHGHRDHAERDLVAAADAVREADPETAARQIAHSARCILYIEGDVQRARALLTEAREALRGLQLEDVEHLWAEALLARWDGDLERAADLLLQAIVLARDTKSHWRQSSCLADLIMIVSESGDADRVESLVRGSLIDAEESEQVLRSPFVEGLAALAELRRDASSTARLDQALEVLRTRSANAQLAYLLAERARLEADAGRLEEAHTAASEAVQLAEAVRRVVPQADALLTMASVCLERGDKGEGLAALARAEELAESGDSLTARVRTRMGEVARALRG